MIEGCVYVSVGVWVSKGMRRQARASTQAQVARDTYAHRLLLVCAGSCICTTTTWQRCRKASSRPWPNCSKYLPHLSYPYMCAGLIHESLYGGRIRPWAQCCKLESGLEADPRLSKLYQNMNVHHSHILWTGEAVRDPSHINMFTTEHACVWVFVGVYVCIERVCVFMCVLAHAHVCVFASLSLSFSLALTLSVSFTHVPSLSLSIYIYTHTYVYVHTNSNIFVFSCIDPYISIYMYRYVCIHVCIFTHIYTCVRTYMYMCIYSYLYIYMRV